MSTNLSWPKVHIFHCFSFRIKTFFLLQFSFGDQWNLVEGYNRAQQPTCLGTTHHCSLNSTVYCSVNHSTWYAMVWEWVIKSLYAPFLFELYTATLLCMNGSTLIQHASQSHASNDAQFCEAQDHHGALTILNNIVPPHYPQRSQLDHFKRSKSDGFQWISCF